MSSPEVSIPTVSFKIEGHLPADRLLALTRLLQQQSLPAPQVPIQNRHELGDEIETIIDYPMTEPFVRKVGKEAGYSSSVTGKLFNSFKSAANVYAYVCAAAQPGRSLDKRSAAFMQHIGPLLSCGIWLGDKGFSYNVLSSLQRAGRLEDIRNVGAFGIHGARLGSLSIGLLNDAIDAKTEQLADLGP